MRKRRVKATMTFSGGVEIQTMEALRENFDLKGCMEYLRDGKLAAWLEDRLYDDEAAAVSALKPDDKNLPQEICKIFGMDFDEVSEQLDDEETIAWRRERRERLKNFTSDATILKRVDDVAFDQDDLIDILREENVPSTIYLCSGNFVFPSGALKRQNITYVGVGDNVTVKIDTQNPVDLDALKISFKNVTVDDPHNATRKLSTPIDGGRKISSENISPNTNFAEGVGVACRRIGTTNNNSRRIVKFASNFQSKISLIFGDNAAVVNDRNITEINFLGVNKGSPVKIVAEGSDAKEAVPAMANFIENRLK